MDIRERGIMGYNLVCESIHCKHVASAPGAALPTDGGMVANASILARLVVGTGGVSLAVEQRGQRCGVAGNNNGSSWR